VVEGARLESVCRGNSTVGSNPTLSAKFCPLFSTAACLNFSETVLEAAERAPAGSLGVRAIPVADQILRGSPSCLTVRRPGRGKARLGRTFRERIG
jgi:hypothetical protein